jgi:hypothetical protein
MKAYRVPPMVLQGKTAATMHVMVAAVLKGGVLISKYLILKDRL